jgi:hypothetical protein
MIRIWGRDRHLVGGVKNFIFAFEILRAGAYV